MRVSELNLDELDEWVAHAMGIRAFRLPNSRNHALQIEDETAELGLRTFNPSTDWKTAGLLIQRERISILAHDNEWEAQMDAKDGRRICCFGNTPIEAAMRCFITNVFGEQIHSDSSPKFPIPKMQGHPLIFSTR